ncbi:MAG: glycerate kinase [Desulfarculus sp.]|nr:glycerate kinase [Desulfarculus sp.]
MTAADLRFHALAILEACLGAVDPYQAVRQALGLEGARLRVGEQVYDLGNFKRIIAVGAGKAGAPMARALEEVLGPRLDGGRVVVKRGHGGPTRVIELLEASHPLPDQGSLDAGRAVMETLAEADEETLVFCLLSGGGSALLVAPAEGLALYDKQETTRLLLASGADIGEINAVRKHLSVIKGGGLARLAAPATVISLIVSDVVGDRLDVIASGPTVGDTSTWAEVRAVLRRHGLLHKVPAVVRQRLEMGVAGRLEETPKPGQDCFGRVRNLIVAGNRQALLAGQARARELGYAPLLLSSSLTGEARSVGQVLSALAREAVASGQPLAPPCCLLAGGETTVSLGDSPGQGGRNQELALAAALSLAGLEGVLLLSAGSDGTDGPTDAAGAFAHGQTVALALALGLKPRLSLERHDAYPLFQALGDLLVTGPTRTNVMDIQILLVAA